MIVVLASLLIVTTPLAGCLDEAALEDLIDDIVGCMDNEAKNYDENATTELVGNCIYAASMDAFMALPYLSFFFRFLLGFFVWTLLSIAFGISTTVSHFILK